MTAISSLGGRKNLGTQVLVQSANSDDTRQISDVQALTSRGGEGAGDRTSQRRRDGQGGRTRSRGLEFP